MFYGEKMTDDLENPPDPPPLPHSLNQGLMSFMYNSDLQLNPKVNNFRRKKYPP